jgi:hypothetical protein
MKKYRLYSPIVALTAILGLAGCGSDSKANSSGTPLNTAGATASIACFYDPDAESGPIKYTLNCYVHTVDGNSDPINDLTYDVSVVADVKVASGGSGTILTTDPITFEASNKSFIDANVKKNDTLIILPTADRNDASYLGNWQISSVNSNTNITLKESAYNLETTDELNYVIGNETVYATDYSASAHIYYPEDGNSTLNVSSDDGLFYFSLVFDYALENQTVYIGAHTPDYRIGAGTAMYLQVEEPEEETE